MGQSGLLLHAPRTEDGAEEKHPPFGGPPAPLCRPSLYDLSGELK